jgi:hypothetical protein
METQSVSVVLRFAFSQNPKKNFPVCFNVSDRYQTTETNKTYGMGNEEG